MIDVIDEFEIRIRKVVAIPEREIWLWKNPQALQSVLTGIEQARAGEFVEAPDIDAALHDLGDEAEAED